MKYIKFSFLVVTIFSLLLVCFNYSYAVGTNKACPQGEVCLNNPLTGDQSSISPQTLIGRIISAVLGLVGSLALLMFIYGGFTWMTAAGNSEKVEKGKQIILWAVIGLAVIFTSYAMVKFVFTSLQV